MKKILLLLIALVSGELCLGQNLKANSIVRATQITFETKQSNPNSGLLFVRNTKNALWNHKAKTSSASLSGIESKDRSALQNSFKEVFTTSRLNQLLSEVWIGIDFYVNTDGKILEIEFDFNKTTSITAAELEKLETSLKKNVQFVLPSNQTKGGDFFIIHHMIRYQQLLNSIKVQ